MRGSCNALVLHILLCYLCQGAANIKCSGRVWVDPAPVVQMGSNISINCLSTLGCPSAKFIILLNYNHTEGPLHPLSSSSVQLRLRDFQLPFGTIVCFSRCPNSAWDQLVCGTEVRAGYPPDPPSNLSCAIAEGSEHLECRWDAGRPPHLLTHHTLHLRRVVAEDEEGAEEEEEEEEKVFPADSPVPLSVLCNRSHYSVWVQARNALGAAHSAPQLLNLQDVVIPALPLVTGAETTETSPPTTTIHWRSQTQLENVHCEERHQAKGTPAWHVEVWDSAAQDEPRWQHNLQSDTQYLFQVRCRLSSPDSPWSAWSPPFLYTTPEAAPAAAPDVWRRLGPAFPNGSHEVTVLIKPLPPRDARGRILGYAVAAETPGGMLVLCNTSSTECSILVQPGAHTLLVTAHNSKGSSSPAIITLGQGASSQEEFPAPVAVEVKPENQSRVLVHWQPPQHSKSPPVWFIVEWVSTSQYRQEEHYFWKKVPSQETHTYIQEEAAAGFHLNVSVYAVYPGGVSKPSSGKVPPEEPLLDSTYNENPHDDDLRVLLGLSIGMVILSVGFAILMFKKSVRKRIKVTIVQLLPKWLFEEFPHVENSNVVKSLQNKSDLMSDSFQDPLLDTSDPTVTEVEEVPAHEEHESVATPRKPSIEVPEDGEHPGAVAPASTTILEHISDYKPQISNGNTLGYVAANIYQMQPPTVLSEPEMSIFGDYTSPVPHLWDGEGGAPQVCLLDKINLILNTSQSGQSQVFVPAMGGHMSLPENQWGQRPPSHDQEQMLVPKELLSCLRSMNRESVDVKPYFPQSTGGLF
ncbi:interleukin-23 receptor [Myiozetetes cayanensis]|uniref:interleukin-23 receptor n=1 Tax=Myiozetetes cayanensis TaxID=478635 RepID=UPI0021600FAC|nr:interleukin-23 receptor [Myiozetetes cayanensis]